MAGDGQGLAPHSRGSPSSAEARAASCLGCSVPGPRGKHECIDAIFLAQSRCHFSPWELLQGPLRLSFSCPFLGPDIPSAHPRICSGQRWELFSNG